MGPVQIDWNSVEVAGREGTFDLEVNFQEPSPQFWWEGFSHALEESSRKVSSARWELIRGVGEPPAGLFVGGIDEGSVASLRLLLDTAVARANEEFDRTMQARRVREEAKARGRSEEDRTAERITAALRSSAAV